MTRDIKTETRPRQRTIAICEDRSIQLSLGCLRRSRYCRMLWIGFRSRGDLLLASFDQLSIHEPGSGPHQGDQPVAV